MAFPNLFFRNFLAASAKFFRIFKDKFTLKFHFQSKLCFFREIEVILPPIWVKIFEVKEVFHFTNVK